MTPEKKWPLWVGMTIAVGTSVAIYLAAGFVYFVFVV
jgi:hypothetical protein